MPKAEVGSTKYLNNKLKSKGLQRLRWYCQVCERQMRDENGFKMHTQSESHVRQMLLVGEDPKKYINSYSQQFQRDFLQLLRTSHGEKQVHLNHFYQEYIANKEHVHMNSTKWPSLTEFAKYLGREGICRVEDNEKGVQVAWIDNSPENLRRQDAIRKRERQDKGDEEREQVMIREQVRRAQIDANGRSDQEVDEEAKELRRGAGETIKLSFGTKTQGEPKSLPDSSIEHNDSKSRSDTAALPPETASTDLKAAKSAPEETGNTIITSNKTTAGGAEPSKVSLKLGPQSKPQNVFAVAKKNALAGKKSIAIEQPKKMSEAERIMREETERKTKRSSYDSGFSGPLQKKHRT